jgi:hypothetical protein
MGPAHGRILCGKTACRCTRPKCHLVTKAGSRSAWNGRLYTMTLGSKSYYKPTGNVLVNSAQLVRKYFKYLGFCSSKMEPDEARRESHRQSNRSQSIIATAASGYKARRSVLRKNGADASSEQDTRFGPQPRC